MTKQERELIKLVLSIEESVIRIADKARHPAVGAVMLMSLHSLAMTMYNVTDDELGVLIESSFDRNIKGENLN